MSEDNINDELEIEDPELRILMIPKKIKKYVIHKKLFETKSAILEAKINSTPNKVALKIMPPDVYEANPDEFNIMTRINHKHVIKAIELFSYPSTKPRFYVIVMPMATTDLLEYVNSQGPIQEKYVNYIMKQSLEALNHIHSLNIWHRDIKLDNIFLLSETRNGPSIAIGDFGNAAIIEQEKIRGEAGGSYQYAAPELLYINRNRVMKFKPIAEYSKNVDLWSMGIVMYALLCGELPFDVFSRSFGPKLLKYDFDLEDIQVSKPNKRSFSSLPDDAKDLIKSLLCPPDERLSIDEAIAHPWFSKFDDDVVDEETDETFKNIEDDDINTTLFG